MNLLTEMMRFRFNRSVIDLDEGRVGGGGGGGCHTPGFGLGLITHCDAVSFVDGGDMSPSYSTLLVCDERIKVIIPGNPMLIHTEKGCAEVGTEC